MRRVHLLEIEDQPWCPKPVRDGATDYLAFLANATRAFDVVAPKLHAAMEAVGTSQVVDLCSGGGGPWPTLHRTLAGYGNLEVVLTDRFPNAKAFARMERVTGGIVRGHCSPVDATDVPTDLEGLRTVFNGFHHFPPELARAILADAVRKRRPIAVLEASDSRLVGTLSALTAGPITSMMAAPFIAPFRWSRFPLTYLVPLIPAIIAFDGFVSMLRIYHADELREMVESIPEHASFDWDIASVPVPWAPMGLTSLVGVPRS